MSPVRFDVSPADRELIGRIVVRARAVGLIELDGLGLTMDLTATHANGCPLDLALLLDAPAFDFAHDIAGIARHLDRLTGKLGDCFVPRCARPEDVSDPRD